MPGRKFKDDRGTARRAMGMREAEVARKRRGLTRLEVGNAVWLNKTDSERQELVRVVLLLAACFGALLLLFMIPAWFEPVFFFSFDIWYFQSLIVCLMLLHLVMPAYAVGELRRRPEAMARYHVCACCGYDLRGAAVEEDGCTVCPECGAAYDLSVRAAPLGRTLRPVWRFWPSWDDRRRHIRLTGLLDPKAPKEARTIAGNLGLGRRFKWWVLGILFGATLVAAFLSRRGFDDGEPFVILMGIVFCIGIPVVWILSRRALRRHAYCPACYESLRGVRPDADGCTACPQCGAAWKLPAKTDERAAVGSEVA